MHFNIILTVSIFIYYFGLSGMSMALQKGSLPKVNILSGFLLLKRLHHIHKNIF